MGTVADENAGFYGEVTSAETPVILGRGARYSVEGATALAVSIGGAGDRAVTIQAGQAWGDGVLSTWDTGAVLNGSAPSGSSTRWDTVVIRREWTPLDSPTGTATLMLLTGGTSPAISGSRTTDAGVTTSDQPLALVRFQGGETAAQEVRDLRAWAGTGTTVVARSDASSYQAAVGSSFFEAERKRLYFREPSSSWFYANLADLDSIPWSRIAVPAGMDSSSLLGVRVGNYSAAADLNTTARVRGSDFEMNLRLRRTASTQEPVSSRGVFENRPTVYQLASAYRPVDGLYPAPMFYRSTFGNAVYAGMAQISANGEIVLIGGTADRPLVQTPEGTAGIFIKLRHTIA